MSDQHTNETRELDLDAIVDKANMPGHVTFPAGAELLALVAEVRRLREERDAYRTSVAGLRASLGFKQGTIDDLAATVERLEDANG